MTENETEKYSNLLGGRLPCSDLEFELCDRLIELEKKVESLSLPSVIGSCTWDKLLEGENLEHKDGYYCEECFYIGYHPNKEHTVYCPCCGRKINYR